MSKKKKSNAYESGFFLLLSFTVLLDISIFFLMIAIFLQNDTLDLISRAGMKKGKSTEILEFFFPLS